MAYVDVDKFAEAICNFQAIDEDAANKMIWLLRTFPTADVAPKSDVAREIFAELGKIRAMDKLCQRVGVIYDTTGEYEELKKKYTEGENGNPCGQEVGGKK